MLIIFYGSQKKQKENLQQVTTIKHLSKLKVKILGSDYIQKKLRNSIEYRILLRCINQI